MLNSVFLRREQHSGEARPGQPTLQATPLGGEANMPREGICKGKINHDSKAKWPLKLGIWKYQDKHSCTMD